MEMERYGSIVQRGMLMMVLSIVLLVAGGCRTMRTTQVYHPHVHPAGTPPRIVLLTDVMNMRDMGGWSAGEGRRVRFGRLYRSAAFDRKDKWFDFGGRPTASSETRGFVVGKLGVKTDLDLRAAHEVRGLRESPLGGTVRWVNVPFTTGIGVNSQEGKEAFRRIFRILQDADNYPIVIHCQFGRDRTGMLCYILNGLLGVSKRDLLDDWQSSLAWFETERYSREKFEREVDAAFADQPGATIQEKIRAYVKALGFTDAEIDSYIAAAIEPVVVH